MKLAAIALTAGQGTRLRPFTEKLAKPALPLLGVPLLLHSLRHLQPLPVEKLVLNTFWRPKDIQLLSQTISWPAQVAISHDGAEILGSGGGVAKASQMLQDYDTLIVLNGDEVLLPKSSDFMFQALEFHKNQKNLATFLVMEHPEVGKQFGGIWVDQDHSVIKFSKASVASAKGFHYIGYMILERKALQYFSNPAKDENILYDCMTRAIEKGERVSVFPIQADWYETGNPQGFVQASQKLAGLLNSNDSDPKTQKLKEFLARAPRQPSQVGFQSPLVDHAKSNLELLSASLLFEDFLRLEFQIQTKSPEKLVWPDPIKNPGRKDELWKSTCFELFLGQQNSSSYLEVNASPSGEWNIYRFDSERQGLRPEPGRCQIFTEKSDEIFRIQINIQTDVIPSEIGATAVLAWKDRQNQYFSLQHSKPQPDFHNRSDWIWRLK